MRLKCSLRIYNVCVQTAEVYLVQSLVLFVRLCWFEALLIQKTEEKREKQTMLRERVHQSIIGNRNVHKRFVRQPKQCWFFRRLPCSERYKWVSLRILKWSVSSWWIFWNVGSSKFSQYGFISKVLDTKFISEKVSTLSCNGSRSVWNVNRSCNEAVVKLSLSQNAYHCSHIAAPTSSSSSSLMSSSSSPYVV